MSDESRERLYQRLPAVHRIRDAKQGEPLRALLGILEQQLDVLERDVEGLYDDWFIETCQEWVVAYIGDLLGVRRVHPIDGGNVFSQRAFVANTLRFRRRKGTLSMLEELARVVTGWKAHAVPFFELLGWNQHLNHLRREPTRTFDPRHLDPHASDRVGTVNLRSMDALDRLDGPFDVLTHSVDVRPIGQLEGRYNIRNIGFFLWRLQSYPLRGVTPRVSSTGPNRFHFSTLGHPAPLFNNPDRKVDDRALAGELNVPGTIRPTAFFANLTDYYGFESDRSLAVFRGAEVDPATMVPGEEILCKDLSDWSEPPAGKVAVDVTLGRLAFHPDEVPEAMTVNYHCGFSADVGGGPYDRRDSIISAEDEDWAVTVAKIEPDPPPPEWRETIREALDDWNPAAHERAVITVVDNGTYEEELSLTPADSQRVVIQAGNENRPTLRLVDGAGNLDRLALTGNTGEDASLRLNGLLIEGHIEVEDGAVGELELIHCTLVPGRALDENGDPVAPGEPSLEVAADNDELEVRLEKCITGALRLPENMSCLEVRDSILDAAHPDPTAQPRTVLLSGNLSPFPTLPPGARQLRVRIGEEGPHTVVLSATPTSLAEARDLLQAALRSAHRSRAFRAARVAIRSNRLILTAGTRERIQVRPSRFDPTANQLRLDAGSAEYRDALLSGPLDPFPTLSAAEPALGAMFGAEGPHDAAPVPVPSSLAQARDRLEQAIRAAHPSAAFSRALVVSHEDRLLVAAGATAAAVAFTSAAAVSDSATYRELALESPRPVLSASLTGDPPGPPAVLERTTIFGEVFVKTLALGSEVIFNQRVLARRRQAGCVRFSYLREGSAVPRRFRCQPDLALEELAADKKTDLDSLPAVDKARVRSRLRPGFTSRRYGQPAYAQLSLNTDPGIREGAEDGSEMGVFQHLKQPQREANLRIRLDEFLPYGLEAGIIYVT